MNKIYKRAFIFSFFFLFINFYADDSIYNGNGETVIPITSNQIEMVEETVIIEKSGSNYPYDQFKADCTFVFHNTGNDTEILMGFPDTYRSNEDPMAESSFSISNFKCSINYKKIKTEFKETENNPELKNIDYPAAYVWKVKFKKDETKIIRNTYRFGGYWSVGWINLKYILKTGALWKGNIKRATIIIKNLDIKYNNAKINGKYGDYNDDFRIINIKPKGYKIIIN